MSPLTSVSGRALSGSATASLGFRSSSRCLWRDGPSSSEPCGQQKRPIRPFVATKPKPETSLTLIESDHLFRWSLRFLWAPPSVGLSWYVFSVTRSRVTGLSEQSLTHSEVPSPPILEDPCSLFSMRKPSISLVGLTSPRRRACANVSRPFKAGQSLTAQTSRCFRPQPSVRSLGSKIAWVLAM